MDGIGEGLRDAARAKGTHGATISRERHIENVAEMLSLPSTGPRLFGQHCSVNADALANPEQFSSFRCYGEVSMFDNDRAVDCRPWGQILAKAIVCA